MTGRSRCRKHSGCRQCCCRKPRKFTTRELSGRDLRLQGRAQRPFADEYEAHTYPPAESPRQRLDQRRESLLRRKPADRDEKHIAFFDPELVTNLDSSRVTTSLRCEIPLRTVTIRSGRRSLHRPLSVKVAYGEDAIQPSPGESLEPRIESGSDRRGGLVKRKPVCRVQHDGSPGGDTCPALPMNPPFEVCV